MNAQKEILKTYNFQLTDEKMNFELDGAVSVGIKTNYNLETVEFIHSLIDHTSLNSTDNEDSVRIFIDKLRKNISKYNMNNVAAVCVFPKYIKLCKEELKDSDIKVACVAGGFPYVQSFKEVRELECKLAAEAGSDEIDIVFPIGELNNEDTTKIREDLKRLREVTTGKTLKVILETGELKTPEKIFISSMLAIEEGADFIKTSTGKTPIGATPEAVYVMAYAIKKHYDKTGRKVGIKVSGGVSSITKAIQYLSIIKHILGEEWITPELFRIGTSGLTVKIHKEYGILKEKEAIKEN